MIDEIQVCLHLCGSCVLVPAAAVVGRVVGAAAYLAHSCFQTLHTELLITARPPLHHREKSGLDAHAGSGYLRMLWTALVSPTMIAVDDKALCCPVHVVHDQLHQNVL